MKHGIVTSKKVASEGHLALTIQSSRAGVTWENVPVAQDHPGAVQNIEEGWHVALDECDDGLWIVLGVINTDPDLLPSSLNGSERVMKFDNGTEISVTMNDSGEYDVDVKATGNITINATGDVTIGDAANAVKLAVQNHTHNYSWTDSGGSGSTDAPNETGTETAVE